ncbi:cholinesterase-like [Amphiura filiformis]|uniref:cholinesterase-like n=1 Tax=Amphiura filiformis TaxID=82378 RepID=UPI003B214E8E
MRFNVTEYPELIADVDVYRGIPFAVPPLGELRLAKPIPSEGWEGEYDATYFRSPCMQSGSAEEVERMSEDCLYLNVWVPKAKPENAAVMLWIYGGGFVFGEGSSYSYNGIPISTINNIVYVTINYRVNSFGFFSLGDDVMPGNYGLWDQQLALKWAKEHIGAFGGNADDITIFGQSAGAASVGLHLVAPLSWDYFSKAILQSGCAVAPWVVEEDKEKARQDVYGVGDNAGCKGQYSNHQELLACLRELPAQNISDATTNVS